MLVDDAIQERLRALTRRGVQIPDERQVYISDDVDPERIFPGSVLWPGTRLVGKRTLVGSNARIGTEGPAMLSNAVVGADAEVASGYLDGAVLLPCARAGANAHFRAGTLLEEEASTAHAVGLKQTILMYGVTLGSLINFCDALLSGGRSRSEHTEVGSGFIHFNYTPWGERGDKATPSLIGTVTDGVFLDRPRIFLGGMSGIVGPQTVGFGAMTAAGQVVRKPVREGMLHAEAGASFDRAFADMEAASSGKRFERVRARNIAYIAQLFALKEWYRHIRLARCDAQRDRELALVLEGALDVVDRCVAERLKRYNELARAGTKPLLPDALPAADIPAPGDIAARRPGLPHDEWVWSLPEEDKRVLRGWLADCAAAARGLLERQC